MGRSKSRGRGARRSTKAKRRSKRAPADRGSANAALAELLPLEGTAAKELVAFRGRQAVTWIGVPELPATGGDAAGVSDAGIGSGRPPTSSPVEGRQTDHSGSSFTWFEESCAGATYVLLYGPDAGPMARRLEQRDEASPQIVRCHGRPDAVRVARVLSCPGDTVLATQHGTLILPGLSFYWRSD